MHQEAEHFDIFSQQVQEQEQEQESNAEPAQDWFKVLGFRVLFIRFMVLGLLMFRVLGLYYAGARSVTVPLRYGMAWKVGSRCKLRARWWQPLSSL